MSMLVLINDVTSSLAILIDHSLYVMRINRKLVVSVKKRKKKEFCLEYLSMKSPRDVDFFAIKYVIVKILS
jgi:hypothetical protein